MSRMVRTPSAPGHRRQDCQVSTRDWRITTIFHNEAIMGGLFITPLVLGLVIFQFGPMIASFLISFTVLDYISPPTWVGLRNYATLLQDELFWRSLHNTLYYVIGVVPLTTVISLFLAMLLNQKIRGIVFFRTIFFLPTVSSVVAISLLWTWIYQPQYGFANFLLSTLGLPKLPWLASPDWAMLGVIIVSIWRSLGFNIILYLAGLQGIHQELYEAAQLDGAGPWHLFRYITVPLLSPTTFFILVLSFIASFQVFESILIMTEGGPYFSTLSIVMYLFNNAFRFFKMGYASAIAYVLFVILLIITFFQVRLQRRWVHYE